MCKYISEIVAEVKRILNQGWIKCGSGEHRSQEMTRKIEEIVTLGYEEKRRGRKKKEKRNKRKKRRRKKRGRNVIEELTEEEKEHGDDKLKSSKANEWGKLDWNWTNRNEEKCEKRQRRKLKKWTRDRWIRNGSKKRRGMKSSNKRNGGKCQGILRKSSQWCNWDMKGKRKVRKKNLKEEEKEKRRGRNSVKGRATDCKFKWSQDNEWGKLDWNNKNEEEFEETYEQICEIGKKIAGSEMQETLEEEWKAETRGKEGKERG